MFAIGRGVIRRKCVNGGKEFNAILDTGSSINVVDEEAAKHMSGNRVSTNKFISGRWACS